MKEADYEPEEGEIQDDDGQEDFQPIVPGIMTLGKSKRNNIHQHSLLSVRGDIPLSHQHTGPGFHSSEYFRSTGLDFVSSGTGYSSRSTRFRNSGMKHRHYHNRSTAKEWDTIKPVSRSTKRETHSRDANGITPKVWCSSFSKIPHEHNMMNNPINDKLTSVTPKWFYGNNTIKGECQKKKITCDKSTNTTNNQQKLAIRSSVRRVNKTSPINTHDTKSENLVDKNEKKTSNKQSSSSPVSSSSDSIEIVDFHRKEPEVITIYDSDEESRNITSASNVQVENNDQLSISNNVEMNKTNDCNALLISTETTSAIPTETHSFAQGTGLTKILTSNDSTQDSKQIDPSLNNFDVNTNDTGTRITSCNETSEKDIINEKNSVLEHSADFLTKNPSQLNDAANVSSSHLPVCEQLQDERSINIPSTHLTQNASNNLTPNNALYSSQLDSLKESKTAMTDSTSDSQSNLKTVSETVVTSNPLISQSDNTSTKGSSVERVLPNKTIQIASKHNLPMPNYVSYLGKSATDDKDNNRHKNSFSLNHVLTNRIYSDSPYITSPSYATVFFDRVGTKGGKSYEGQNYKLSVEVPEFIINLGKDSDSGDESDSKLELSTDPLTQNPNMQVNSEKNTLPSPISVDFEKKLDVLLKQARYQQEENPQKIPENIKAIDTPKSNTLPSATTSNNCVSTTSLIRQSVVTTTIPGGCARVMPTLKSVVNSKFCRTKSKNGVVKNLFSNLYHDKYNGNGLFVKAAKRLVSRSVDHSKQLALSSNKGYHTKSKVINQAPSITTDVNIGLLSPNKQREYIKLKRKLVQLTGKSKESRCVGKHEIVTSTILSLKGSKQDDVKVNKVALKTTAMKNHKQSLVHQSFITCEYIQGNNKNTTTASPKSMNCNASPSETIIHSNNMNLSNHSMQNEFNLVPSKQTESTSVSSEINASGHMVVVQRNLSVKDHKICSNNLQNNNFETNNKNMTMPWSSTEQENKECAQLSKRKKSISGNCKSLSQKKQRSERKTEDNLVTSLDVTSLKGKLAEQLWSSETKLIAKRRHVLEDIATVRLNLHKIEAVNFKRDQMMEEIQKLKEQIKQAELNFIQKEENLKVLNVCVSDSKLNIQKGQSELLSLTLECEELGCKVHGPNYNVPNTCADLIRNEMSAMTEAVQDMEIKKTHNAILK